MPLDSGASRERAPQEDMSDYVAQLQLHMSLQAKNLVPSLAHSSDRHQNLLEQTQADFEKHISRKNLRI
ncbi:MAG: hypothetical protein AAGB01_02390 [Cyanobacteria bacterium P01_F01_bin.42]